MPPMPHFTPCGGHSRCFLKAWETGESWNGGTGWQQGAGLRRVADSVHFGIPSRTEAYSACVLLPYVLYLRYEKKGNRPQGGLTS